MLVAGAAAAVILTACGGSDGGSPANNGGGNTPPPLISYVGTTGVFAAWVDPTSGLYGALSSTSYAGKKQILRGTVDFLSGTDVGQAAGVEVFKGSDGAIHALELTTSSSVAPQQLSSESAATVDDTCTLSGTAVANANYDYVGVYFTADLQTPTNSSYVYRLPGPDGVCNTADDVFHMVKTGMSATDAPIVATAMPLATVRTATGGISGFVVKDGASLDLVDGNFANPVALGSFAAPIGVAEALPLGTTQGYPSGELFVIDGSIYFVDFVAHSVSAALYTIPNWSPTARGALYAAAPSSLYLAVNTPRAGSVAASTSIYAMPADGSAAPVQIDSEPGFIENVVYPVAGSNLIWGVTSNGVYSIKTLPSAGGPIATLVTTTEPNGTFIATASTVYYDFYSQTYDSSNNVQTRFGTTSGIVGIDGTVIQAPLANSTFVSGGEQLPWPADAITTVTPYVTLFQVQGLAPVTVTNASTGEQYVFDGVGGGTLLAIDAATNQAGVTVGTLPASTATALSGTFRSDTHTGFLEASNPLSTENPATRDLYLLNSQSAGTLTLITNTL
jgi:hypothetical protein